ncbi:hypothetical protein B9K03_11830 [Rothia sp. Olga]|nr:hypothetical protein B9K03_11830 [Rothia sp. Olga]
MKVPLETKTMVEETTDLRMFLILLLVRETTLESKLTVILDLVSLTLVRRLDKVGVMIRRN